MSCMHSWANDSFDSHSLFKEVRYTRSVELRGTNQRLFAVKPLCV